MSPAGNGPVDPRVIRELWDVICERAAHPDEGFVHEPAFK